MSAGKKKKKLDDTRMGYIVAGLVFLGAVLFGTFVLPRLGSKHRALGGQAPDLSLPAVAGRPQGSTVHLSDFDGKVVIVDFWATWCGPCRMQAPIVARVAQDYASKGVTVLAVATSDQRASVEQYLKYNAPPYVVAFDEDELAARTYGVEGLPTLAVVGKRGKLVALRTGLIREGELRGIVETALKDD